MTSGDMKIAAPGSTPKAATSLFIYFPMPIPLSTDTFYSTGFFKSIYILLYNPACHS